MIRLIGKYLTETDDGRRAIVHEYQEFIEIDTKDGVELIPGMKLLRLEDGTTLSPTDDERAFRTTDRQTIYRRVD